MAITSAQFDALLKKFYTPEKLKTSLFTKFPFLEHISKKENCGGSQVIQPVMNGAIVRRSTDYTTGYNGLDATPAVAFAIDFSQDYAFTTIQGKVMRQSEKAGSVGAFVSVFTQQKDACMAALRKSMSLKLVRTGTGSVANIKAGASVSTTAIQLAQPGDAFCFENGDPIAVSSVTSSDGASIRIATASVTVTNVDVNTGTIYLSSVLNSSITLATAGDYVYNAGDAQNGATSPSTLMGLQGYCANSSQTAAPLFGVTRANDLRKLAGLYISNTGGVPADQQLQKGVQALLSNGGSPKAIYVNPNDYLDLTLITGSKVLRDAGGTGTLGFKALCLDTIAGSLPIYPDPSFPQKKGFILDTDDMWLACAGPAVSVLKEADAPALTRVAGSDAYYLVFGGVYNLVVARPGMDICQVEFA